MIEFYSASWFVLIAVLVVGYAILDGFDLGVGILHLWLPKTQEEKRLFINAIAPVWDGNEVWLLAAGGALFAAFPPAYASILSGLYIPVMLLLVVIIFRAVSMEFRTKVESTVWQNIWDFVFGISSFLIAFLLGVVAGNILRGLPIGENQAWIDQGWSIINPFSLLTGLMTVFLFAMHGSHFLQLKIASEKLLDRIKSVGPNLWIGFVFTYILVVLLSFFETQYLFKMIKHNRIFDLFFILFLVSMVLIPVYQNTRRPLAAFLSGSGMILSLIGLAAALYFPNILYSKLSANFSLTLYNASASLLSLKTMFFIAICTMPIIIIYTAVIYWIFRAKVVIDSNSY